MAEPTNQPGSSSDAARAAKRVREELELRLSTHAGSTQREPAQSPPAIPEHTLLRCVGRGSYGEVWLARNTLGTLRAVKIIYRARFEEDRPFEREFHGILKYEPVSRTHEGLVQVLHAGRNEAAGYFYYVMELGDPVDADGGMPIPDSYQPKTLRSELARLRRLPAAEAATLVLRLAAALAHLHARGLVHRDIKPSNVIFVSGRPKLADIGLVTEAGDSRSFVGTEGFIPPEGPGTPQGDIFALGKLLYELATGRDRLEFPDLPRDLESLPEREVLLELNEILARACAPEMPKRYPSATELQADLNLFLAGRSLRHARATERTLARLKQYALAASLLVLAVLAALWVSKRAERQAVARAQAEAALRARAETAERQTQQQLYTALLEQARATARSGELGHRVRTLDAVRRAATITNSAELRREALTAMSLPDLRFEQTLPISGESTFAQLDPAFGRIALSRGTGPVEVRSAADGRLLASLPASADLPVFLLRWSTDGRFLAVKRDRTGGQGAADLEVWEVAAQRCVLRAQDASYRAVVFHPLLPMFMASSDDGAITLWELENGNTIARYGVPTAPRALAFSPGGERFAVAHGRYPEAIVSVHRATDGVVTASVTLPEFVPCLAWHPDGRWIAATDYNGSVYLVDSRTGEFRTLGRHKAEAVTAVFSPDGGYLLTGGWERELICWDLRLMQRAFPIALESYDAQFRADGQACALLTRSAMLLYSFELPTSHREFTEDLGGRLRQAAFSPDGRWLAVTGKDHLGVWNLASGGPGALTTEGAAGRVFFRPDGLELFATHDTGCFAWRVTPATNAAAPPALDRVEIQKPAAATSLCVASNRIVLTSARGSQVVSSADLATRESRWIRTSSGINKASPDGRWVAIFRAYTPVLNVYRLPGLEHVARLTNSANIGTFEFSPAGDELAVASPAGITFWNTTTWQPTRELTNCMAMLWAPQARAWWLTRDFRTAGLYDQHTQALLLPLPTGMLPLALSPDGRHLAVSVDARQLQVWDLVDVRQRLAGLGLDWPEP